MWQIPLPTLTFVCNICGESNDAHPMTLDRETASCAGCGSNVRWRSVVHLLSKALFGTSLGLWAFPSRPDLTGIGLSDWPGYAERLAPKLSYRNTHYDREPRLDITDPPSDLHRSLDFLIASDVFEHVDPPVERAFENAFRLLKPGGVLVLTVPYAISGGTDEHFASLHQYEIVEFKGRPIVVNRTADDRWEVFEDLVFHGGPGSTLEMRRFSRDPLLAGVREAGFTEIVVSDHACPEFGILWLLPFGIPILARRPPD
jgi:SAM-dependent methyltransferase